MRMRKEIWARLHGVGRWYMGLILLCFFVVYFLAAPYYLLQYCEDGLHLIQETHCGRGIGPLVIQMNAETLDTRVGSLLPPLSFTEGLGCHLLGTDALGRDVLAGILYGGQRSLLIGLLAGGMAMVLGWFIGLGSVYGQWFRRSISLHWILIAGLISVGWLTHMYWIIILGIGLAFFIIWGRWNSVFPVKSISMPWVWSRSIEWYQALPDLLFLLVLSAAIGVLNIWELGIIIVLVTWPSVALIARRMAVEVSHKPFFRQAIRNNVSGRALFFQYLWGNTRAAFRGLFPLVVARVILLEATISFLGLGLPPDVVTIGSMISAARHNMSAWWLIVFSGMFIFILVYPLLMLGKPDRKCA